MQVDPIKPTLKAPGTKRLNLKYDELLSDVAFKFKLRRYRKGDADLMIAGGCEVGAYTRPLFNST